MILVARTLHPGSEFVDLDALVGAHVGLFDVDLPVGEVFFGDEAALLLRAADEFVGDVAFVEPVISGVDRFLTGFAGLQSYRFGIDELLKRIEQIELLEYLTGVGGFAFFFSQVRQKYLPGVGPFFDKVFESFDGIGGLGFKKWPCTQEVSL